MKLIINNNDIYDLGHDDSMPEYILYVVTEDNVIVKAWDKIYNGVLDEMKALIYKDYNITETIKVKYGENVEDALRD